MMSCSYLTGIFHTLCLEFHRLWVSSETAGIMVNTDCLIFDRGLV